MTVDPQIPYLTQLCDRTIECAAFRDATHQLTHLLAQKAVTHLKNDAPITLIPILRSGLAMLPIFLEYFPKASIGVLGLQRNTQTAHTEQYYCNIPLLSPAHYVIILDPMIATGNTACAAFDIITQHVPIQQILFVGFMSSSRGAHTLATAHPGAQLIVASEHEHLDENNYIAPGLGDFGDRYFGTIE